MPSQPSLHLKVVGEFVFYLGLVFFQLLKYSARNKIIQRKCYTVWTFLWFKMPTYMHLSPIVFKFLPPLTPKIGLKISQVGYPHLKALKIQCPSLKCLKSNGTGFKERERGLPAFLNNWPKILFFTKRCIKSIQPNIWGLHAHVGGPHRNFLLLVIPFLTQKSHFYIQA